MWPINLIKHLPFREVELLLIKINHQIFLKMDNLEALLTIRSHLWLKKHIQSHQTLKS